MKQIFGLFFILICLSGCSKGQETNGEVPVIDIVNSIGNYQRVYCSDLFSSMELIPLETREECLLNKIPFPHIIFDDNHIFINSNQFGNQELYAFGRSGVFLNQIGKKGQGPGEYIYSSSFFLNSDRQTIFVEDLSQILEYDYRGNFIRGFKSILESGEGLFFNNYTYVEDHVFVANARYKGYNPFDYCLINSKGEVIKTFPNHAVENKNSTINSYSQGALRPVRVKDRVYLKEITNDTIYVLKNRELQPAYVFGLGKYEYPFESIERFGPQQSFFLNAIRFIPASQFVVTENFIFYHVTLPESVPKPKAKPRYRPLTNEKASDDLAVYGIYNIEQHKNMLLDTDDYFQKGIVNDLNGGLPFIPIYYAGNNVLVGIWWADDMKETLTDEYFTRQTIKDPQAHQKLKELLKKLKDDDNPVVVVAKLK
ncbi:MAG: 6-bladed beta-propeller [Tannerella sp.]|jgi:hypothetical protein|nr:6-bladed beta-propeller [Tannerella sp.]